MENKEELQQNKNEIETLLESARSDVASLEEIKIEAATIRTNMRTRDTESTNKDIEITRLQTSATQLESQIRTTLNSVTEIVSEIQTYKITFDPLKTKMEDEEEGVEALYNEVEQYRDNAASLKKEADKITVDIKTRLSEVDQIKVQATEGRDHIKGLATESESLKDSIQENLELVTDSVLQNAFKEREKTLLKFVLLWLGVSVVSIVALAWGVMYMFNKLSSNGFNGWEDWYRLLFLTPLIFLVVWSTRNYGQERRLHEKYAYKAVISTSLTSYIKLLTDKFEDAQDEVLDFTKETLSKIFKEPYEDMSAKVRGNVSLWNVFKADIELDDEVKEDIKKQIQKTAVVPAKPLSSEK